MRRTRGWLVALTLALLVPAACARQQAPSPRHGLDATALTRRIDQLLGLNPAQDRLRAIVVRQDGHVVYEHYQRATPAEHWNTDSITSTVVATLVGIAVQEHSIPGLGATLRQLLPERTRSMSPAVAHTDLRQLLTMTAGFDVPAIDRARAFLTTTDPVGEILRSQKTAPGRFFDYSDEGAHLLAAVLRRATGMSVLDYARSRLFQPLGISSTPATEPLGTDDALAGHGPDLAWAVDRSGLDEGWNGLRLTPRDLARIGQVFLDGGRWHDHQVVPQSWAGVSTLTQVSTGYEVAPAYGYGWWVDDSPGANAYYAWGYGGQLLEVLPQVDAVVVVMTQQDPNNLVRGFFAAELTSLVSDAILPALRQAGP
ncbi:MAG: serine hydrolase [Marmoricola sp.]|nr:serine hydrolase [Marmoricola sp.]